MPLAHVSGGSLNPQADIPLSDSLWAIVRIVIKLMKSVGMESSGSRSIEVVDNCQMNLVSQVDDCCWRRPTRSLDSTLSIKVTDHSTRGATDQAPLITIIFLELNDGSTETEGSQVSCHVNSLISAATNAEIVRREKS